MIIVGRLWRGSREFFSWQWAVGSGQFGSSAVGSGELAVGSRGVLLTFVGVDDSLCKKYTLLPIFT